MQAVVTALNNALALKAPLASPALTGTPTAPTAAQTVNNTQIATTAFVKSAIAALVASSPAALDTLNELAAALGNDPNFATTMTNALAGKQPLDSTLTTLSGKTAAGIGIVGENGPEIVNGPANVTSRRRTAALASVVAGVMGVAAAPAEAAPLHPYSLPTVAYKQSQPANRTYANRSNAERAAKMQWERLQRGVASFSLQLAEGRADLYTEMPVKVSGFKQPIDDAEWTITTLTHTVSPDNGFTTSLELEVKIDDLEME